MWGLVLVAFFFHVLPVSVFSENTAPSTPTTTDTTQQTQQPTQQPEDRKDGASSAEKMAMVGAAIAAAMCAMMMAQAQQMPPGPQKDMMMMQAMQQCAQAAANQKNAGDNEKAKTAVANNTPTGSQQAAKNPTNSNPTPTQPGTGGNTTPNPDVEDPTPIAEPTLKDPDAIPEPTDIGSSFDGSGGFAAAGTSTPDAIENSEVSFNENNKGDEGRINPPGGANFGGVGSSGTLQADKSKEEEGDGKGKRRTKGEDGDNEFSVGDGQEMAGAGSAVNPVALDKMLADIMGGKQEPIPVLGANSGIVILRNVGERKMTIFELANTRYKRAGYSEGLVNVRKPNRYRAPTSVPDTSLIVSK